MIQPTSIAMVRLTATLAQMMGVEIDRKRDAMTNAAEITLREQLATLGVSDAGVSAMMRACALAYPTEACGFVLQDGSVVALANTAAAPEREYLIAPEALAAHGERVIGVFHSHPDGEARFSARDRELMQDGWRYIVLATRGPVVSGVAII
jgi:proteasome lid subunit RPN8/RPN11